MYSRSLKYTLKIYTLLNILQSCNILECHIMYVDCWW
jgi:hypothetical protein